MIEKKLGLSRLDSVIFGEARTQGVIERVKRTLRSHLCTHLLASLRRSLATTRMTLAHETHARNTERAPRGSRWVQSGESHRVALDREQPFGTHARGATALA